MHCYQAEFFAKWAGRVAMMLILLAPARFAAADATTEAQLRAALQTATTQIAALEDQVANLQASQAPNVAMIEALRAQVQHLQAGTASSPSTSAAGSAKQAAALAALARQLAARDADLGKSKASYQTEAAANAALQAQLTTANSGLASCTAKNAQLYDISTQILDAYSHKDDFFAAFANHEPFTQLKRVQLENIVQGDQDKIDANQITPARSGP